MDLSLLSPQELLAEVMWREASGEGHIGMIAVGWTVKNRTIAWRQTYQQVILGPRQFTSMISSYPRTHTDDDAVWQDALNSAALIMAGGIPDPTDGACYYENPQIADSPWFQKNIVENPAHPETARFGKHIFYR